MSLGRTVRLLQAEHHCPIRISWLTKIFVAGDVVSFAVQAIGAVIISQQTKENLRRGSQIVIVGLVVQMLFFGLFMLTGLLIHWRTNRQPTDRSRNPAIPWKPHFWTLYMASLIILARCVYRFIEYSMQAGGESGYLIEHEWCMYVFDAVLMALVLVLFFVRHPSEIHALSKPRGGFAMKYLAGRPLQPINDRWHGLPPPVLDSRVYYQPGSTAARMSTHPPRGGHLFR
jgi:magnesium-transporting ATPase (P-type)